MSEANKSKVNNKIDSKTTNWLLTYFISFVLGVFILRELLGLWFSKETAFIISLFVYSAFFYFMPTQPNWFNEKFGSGVKSFALFTFSVGWSVTLLYLLLKFLVEFVFPSFRFYLPFEIGVGVVIISFFIFVALMFHWIIKSTNK